MSYSHYIVNELEEIEACIGAFDLEGPVRDAFGTLEGNRQFLAVILEGEKAVGRRSLFYSLTLLIDRERGVYGGAGVLLGTDKEHREPLAKAFRGVADRVREMVEECHEWEEREERHYHGTDEA